MERLKFILLTLAIAISVVLIGSVKRPEKKVLGLVSPVVEITPTATPSAILTPTASPSAEPIATPSVTATPKPTATPTKKPKPVPTPTPTAELSQEVNEYIERFAGQYGIDPNVIRYIAICESGFRSNAVNGPYVGLFQFGAISWTNIRKEMNEETNPDLRYSAEESVQTVAYALSKGKEKMWPNCIP